MKNIGQNLIATILIMLISSCYSPINFLDSSTNISGIVKYRDGNSYRIAYTHRYLNNTIKALPILITTGIIKKSRDHFSEIEFRVYNKEDFSNYMYVELYNSKGDKWEWKVNKKNKRFINKRYFTIESYVARIDSQIETLIQFFNDEAIYLKFIGDKNNFKRLEAKHVNSLIKVLNYSKNISHNE